MRDFLNDTLTCTLLAMTYGPLGQDGAFQRLQVGYDLRDNVVITGGGVLYQSGDLPEFRNIGDNDRIFGEVACHFKRLLLPLLRWVGIQTRIADNQPFSLSLDIRVPS